MDKRSFTREGIIIYMTNKCFNFLISNLGKISGRCSQCDGCKAQNCGQCTFCIDMPRFGGPGLKKKACIHRKCQHKVSCV